MATAVDLTEKSSSVDRSEDVLETDNGMNNEASLDDSGTEASLAVDSDEASLHVTRTEKSFVADKNEATEAFDRSDENLVVNDGEERLTVEKDQPEDKNENIQTSGAVDKDVLKKLLFGTSHALNLI